MGKFTGLVFIFAGVGIASYAAPSWEPRSPGSAPVASIDASAERVSTLAGVTTDTERATVTPVTILNSTQPARVTPRVFSANNPRLAGARDAGVNTRRVPLPSRRLESGQNVTRLASVDRQIAPSNPAPDQLTIRSRQRSFSAKSPLLQPVAPRNTADDTATARSTTLAKVEKPGILSTWYRKLVPTTTPKKPSSVTIASHNTGSGATEPRRSGIQNRSAAVPAAVRPAKDNWVVAAKESTNTRSVTHKLVSAPINNADGGAQDRFEAVKPQGDQARLALTRDLQRELVRVGCYSGNIDGSWGPASRQAMLRFTQRVNATLPLEEPDYILLTLIQGHAAKACTTPCAADQMLSNSGQCLPKQTLAAVITGQTPGTIVPARPASRENAPTINSQSETKPAKIKSNSLRRNVQRNQQKRRLNRRLEEKVLANAARAAQRRSARRLAAQRLAAQRQDKRPLAGMMSIRGPVRAIERPVGLRSRAQTIPVPTARRTVLGRDRTTIENVNDALVLPPLPVRMARPMRRSNVQRHTALTRTRAPIIRTPTFNDAAVQEALREERRAARAADRREQARSERAQARRDAAQQTNEDRAQARRDARAEQQRQASKRSRRRRLARDARARASYVGASKRQRRANRSKRKSSKRAWQREAFGGNHF